MRSARCLPLMLAGLLTLLDSPIAHAQSASRGPGPGPASRGPGAGSQGFRPRELNTLNRETSIASITRGDLNIGTRQLTNVGGRPRTSFNPAPPRARAASFGATRPATVAKPFSSVRPRPTVSPYLGLFNETSDFNAVNFNTVVQPLQQQQQLSRELQRQQQDAQRQQQAFVQQQSAINLRLQQLSARPAFNPVGSSIVAPTGHPTTFGNTGQYYGGRR